MASKDEESVIVEEESKNTEKTMEYVQPEPQEGEEKKKKKEDEELFTKEQVNEIVKGRLAKERKKYDNYDEYKESATKVEGLEEKYKKASAELETLKHEKQVNEWKAKASEETGIDPKILRGQTEEEIFEHANAIKDTFSSYPNVKQGENPNAEGQKDSPRQALESALDRGNWGLQ